MKIQTKLFLITSLLLASGVNADEREHLIKGEITNGGFGGPVLKLTRMKGETNFLFGGRGAWLVNHRYYLGGAGYGSTRKIGDSDLRLGYGGMWAGMKFKPSRLVHYSVDILLGAGGLNTTHHPHNTGSDSDTDAVFILEPAANLNINIATPLEFVLGVSYRLVSASNQATLSDSDLSGATLTASFVFGHF